MNVRILKIDEVKGVQICAKVRFIGGSEYAVAWVLMNQLEKE